MAAWVTQHERQISWKLRHRAEATLFLILDRHMEGPAAFDTVFVAESTIIIRTPYQEPNGHAFAERGGSGLCTGNVSTSF